MPYSRASVLTANLRNYDAFVASYRAEIAARPQEAATLRQEGCAYAKWYQCDPRAAHVPPMLCREPWEAAPDWLDRAYAAGGYKP